jgi:putative N-acetylmannosamine-6-phosphate epimerase
MKLIVSVQGFDLQTTQKLSDGFLKSGASGIRTDQPIFCEGLLIGLRKNKKQYYITTDVDDVKEVSSWSKAVAIDSRAGNPDIIELYAAAKKQIVADIENEDDLKNLQELFTIGKIKQPEYIATTFSNQKSGAPDVELLLKVYDYFPGASVIAEGGYFHNLEIAKRFGAHYVCIGAGLTDIFDKSKQIAEAIK